MKLVILSADGDSVVYSVPDIVADHLEDYCLAKKAVRLKEFAPTGGVLNISLDKNEVEFL